MMQRKVLLTALGNLLAVVGLVVFFGTQLRVGVMVAGAVALGSALGIAIGGWFQRNGYTMEQLTEQ